MKWLAFIAVLATGSLLIYGVSDFPDWGSADSPANSGVPGAGPSISKTFIEETDTLTHVPNMVTAVLADFRGYDTMFETVVIFAAGIAIIAILRVVNPPRRDPVMNQSSIHRPMVITRELLSDQPAVS